jgi:hypothetical protein
MTVRYQTIRVDDVAQRECDEGDAHERRRFGYRRLHVLLSAVVASGRWAHGRRC